MTMEQINVDQELERLKQQMGAKSTGRKVTPNGYEWYKPIYHEPVVVKKKVDLSVYGIKGRYVDMTFDKLKAQGAPVEDRQAYNNAFKYGVHVREHITNGRGLIMIGPVGTGKTSLAISILRKAIEQGYNGYLISMTSLFDTLLTLSKGPSEHYLKFENRIRNSPLLVLDDFGAEYASEWVQQKVASIIADRVERSKSTIITSNLSVEQIKKAYDSRVYDRLKGTSFLISFKGKSQRQPLDINEI